MNQFNLILCGKLSSFNDPHLFLATSTDENHVRERNII